MKWVHNGQMNYCPNCSEALHEKVPAGDDRLRHVCLSCGTIHYQNPKVIAGCVPFYGDRVLLCRRAIEPRLGFWTLPAGFMELGESVSEAAGREAAEEACVKVVTEACYTLFSLPALSQVYIFYLAPMPEPQFKPGSESLEVALFREDEIPWEDLAFETVRRTLRHFFSDLKNGSFAFREEVVHIGKRGDP